MNRKAAIRMTKNRTYLLVTLPAQLVLALNLCFAPSAGASITVANYWRMGEGQGGNGNVVVTTTDIVGGKTLTLPGGPILNSGVAAEAASHVGSTMAMNFFTAGVYGTYSNVLSSAVNNFGIELWVNPNDTNGYKTVVYNGDSGANGWGIYQDGNTYKCLLGGVTFFGSATATAGGWTHLALVRNNGTATFYVNGVASGSTTTSAPLTPTGKFGIAAKSVDATQERFAGMLDEMRFFTFTAGQFSTNDLLLRAGQPRAISAAASSITATSASLNGTVNPNALDTAWYFQYGPTISYGFSTTTEGLPFSTSDSVVSASVSNLLPGTLYHFRLVAANSAGTTNAGDLTFTTPVAVPAAITQAATSITSTGATLNASINPNGAATSYYFQYGLTASYGSFSSTNTLATGNSLISTNRTITGLAPGTLYHFRVVAVNSAGTTNAGDLTFSTGPVVATLPATSLTSTGATLNAMINPGGVATTAWFEWGIGSIYNQQTTPTSVGSGSSSVAFSNVLTGLTAGLAYHGRAVASNSIGVVRGQDVRFWSPVLTLNGPSQITNALGTAFTDPGATVSASPQTLVGGSGHTMALKPNGTIAAWGKNQFGQTVVPSGATNVAVMAAGDAFSLAARVNGTCIGWGENGDGQTNVPPSATNVIALAGGGYHGLALRTDATLVAWGANNSGQGVVPAGLTNIVSVKAGEEFNVALRTNGTVFCWGLNTSGQTNVPSSATNVLAVAAGRDHCLALRSDGTVVGWGLNDLGQANIPASVTNVIAIAAASGHNLALRSNGTLVTWGYSGEGLSTIPPGATNIVAIAVGYFHSLALRADGTVFAWGRNSDGQCNVLSDVSTLAQTVSVSGSVNTSVPGTYQLTYSTTNSLGAVATAVRTVVVTAPMLPAVTTQSATSLSSTGATLNASINPNYGATAYYFQYGLTTNYGSFSPTNSLPATNTVFSVNRVLTGLDFGTLYHFRIVAANSAGITNGADLTFTTPNGIPTVTTLAATDVTSTSATLNGMVNPHNQNVACQFQYGAVHYTNAPTYPVNPPATNVWVPISTPISGLTPGTVYRFQILVGYGIGVAYGSDVTFTTAPPVSVTTLPATAVTTTSATLNGSVVNPSGPTTAHFQYGLTTNYGSFSSTQNVALVDSGLNFNGVNQSASGSPISGLATGSTPHTIEAWLKPTLAPSGREWALLLGNAGAGAHHWLIQPNGVTQIGVFNGNQVNPVLQSNVWTHLAATYDGTTLSVYTNGVLAGTNATSFNLAGVSLNLGQAVAGESYYGGAMDEVRVWNVARTAAQIQAAYNTTLTGNEPGLLAYFRMDEGTGSVLNDTSGHTNNLMTVGSPAWTNGAPLTWTYGTPFAISRSVAGLIPDTTYHYRIVAKYSGGTTNGADMTFTTAAAQVSSPLLTSPTMLANGSFQFDFTNTPGASFTVLASTNVALPLANWTLLSNVVESPAGQFRFTDPQATNSGQRFYQVRSP